MVVPGGQDWDAAIATLGPCAVSALRGLWQVPSSVPLRELQSYERFVNGEITIDLALIVGELVES